MPSNKNPGDIRTGAGSSSTTNENDLDLTGAGMVGAGPNIGEIEGTVDPIPSEGVLVEAVEVTTDDNPDLISSGTVEGSLDELAGAIPQRPPQIGFISRQISFDFPSPTEFKFSGAPDWGVLKLVEHDLIAKGQLSSDNDAANIYPYYHEPPSPALDGPDFTTTPGQGADPQTDFLFNSGVTTIDGAGEGQSYAGAFTRVPAGGTFGDVIRTDRIIKRTSVIDGGTGLPERQEAVVSGYVYPADRGVLALIHWPAGGDSTDFLAQPVLDRCIAAIVLGQGITGADPADCDAVDGSPGGIFAVGTDADGNYDPFVFPGRATGQPHLLELIRGRSDVDNSLLPSPYDDLDGDATTGMARVSNADAPIPSQVRLASDPAAGVTPEEFGIPILGAYREAYDPNPAIGDLIGNSIMTDEDDNFFNHRLPYLDDYTQESGLKYTFRGEDPADTLETGRYFEERYISESAPFGSGNDLENAGGYDGFTKDYWVWQIARFRHKFALPSTQPAGQPEDAGSYFLIHFKTESDFEKLVRDGILPDDATDGYDTYSTKINSESDSPETLNNVVKTYTGVNDPTDPYALRAPAYGYEAFSYHSARVSVFLDPDADVVDTAGISTNLGWDSDSTSGAEIVHVVSGIRYFAPFDPSTGNNAFRLTTVTTNLPGFWSYSYRTDNQNSDDIFGSPSHPAYLASPNPVFIGLHHFSKEGNYNVGTGSPGAGTTRNGLDDDGRVEFPYTYCGSNANGLFDENNGPRPGDDLDLAFFNATTPLTGNQTTPVFVTDARARVFFRKPGAHKTPDEAVQPYTADDGHGVEMTLVPSGPLMWHEAIYYDSGLFTFYPRFGNFQDTPPNGPVSRFATEGDKDYVEHFLDEVYRWKVDWDSGLGASLQNYLIGPGMQGYIGGAIDVPLVAGASDPPWDDASYIMSGQYLDSLRDTDPGELELQVAGMPYRNPPLSDGVTTPFPLNGILIYPQTDYEGGGYRPSSAAGDLTNPQPDYSTNVTGVRAYVRTLDVSVMETEDVEGTQTFHLRVDGLSLADFAYNAPGPGGLNGASGIAIFVKVPGLTTWMDVGRVDGDGPSKQDPALDGAGCQIAGSTTLEAQDPETGVVYSQVKINVGPAASLFKSVVNHTYEGGVPSFEDLTYVPILVKVEMDSQAAAYNLKEEYTAVGTFTPGQKPGLSWASVRGLIGLQIVPESSV